MTRSASMRSAKILQLLPAECLGPGRAPDVLPYQRLLKVLDFVSGMTDSYAVSLYKKTLEAHRRRLAMLERLLSVCPGCGAIGVNVGGWRKASEFHQENPEQFTLCPTCAAAYQPDVTPDTSRASNG